MSKTAKKILYLLAASLLLSYWAFVNQFPLVFSDTGTYLGSGFTNEYPIDRPIFYGWFLRHLSLEDSLYLPVLVQSFMLAYVLRLWVKTFGQKRYQNIQFLLLTLLLTLFTGASIQTSQLIPDVFTSIMLLSTGLLLLNASITSGERTTIYVLLLVSLLMHSSHVITMWLALGIIGLINLVRYRRQLKHSFNRAWVPVVTLTIAAQIIIPSTSYLLGSGFNSSKSEHVFLMNRMVKFGILEDYLNNVCDHKDYKFCAYANDIPRSNFVWNYEKSPLYLTGGWEANKEEYDAIIADILSQSKYYPKLFFRALETSLQQFFTYRIGDTAGPYMEESSPHHFIKWFFPELERFYFRAEQQEQKLDFTAINNYHNILVLSSLALCIIFLFRQRTSLVNRDLLEIILIFLIANAIICGVFAGVFDRYQCRIIFVLIIPFYLAIWRLPILQKYLPADKDL